MARTLEGAEVMRFHEEGFLGPLSLLDLAACSRITTHFRRNDRPRRPWPKGGALNDPFLYDCATSAPLLSLLVPLLGNDIVLWGVQLVTSVPGHVHSWHTDIETAARDSRCVSIWIGLEHTSPESGLQIMSRSHGFGKPFQQVAFEHGRRRSQATRDDVVAWARAHDPQSTLVRPDVTDGSAIVFDGRLWHASENQTRSTRRALLLQYADPRTPILMPERRSYEWPFAYKELAPVLLVHASAQGAVDPGVRPVFDNAHTLSLPRRARQ